ncbi:hypothetical protein RZS08_56745, partial [Arthrospira platensis SPKY1]|nr:hypothetical protein [Arthrospira platensis SPKY1]
MPARRVIKQEVDLLLSDLRLHLHQEIKLGPRQALEIVLLRRNVKIDVATTLPVVRARPEKPQL